MLRIFWVLFVRCAKFHRNLWKEFRDVLELLQKGYKLCMNWRLDSMQTKLLHLDVLRRGLSRIRLANYPYTLFNQLNVSRLTRKHVNSCKTQCWALFVISKATFTKRMIKPKFDSRFSLKIFSDAIDQSTIKCIRLEIQIWKVSLQNSGIEPPPPLEPPHK